MKLSERRIAIRDLIEHSGVRFGTSGARGLVAAMTDEACFAYAAAFLQTMALPAGSTVALGIDLRPSSPRIAAACAAAIRQAGLVVDYCGALPTPALAWHAQTKGVPGLMVTGSHIPFDRNGIKFYRASGEISKADEAGIAAAVVTLPAAIDAEPLAATDPSAKQSYIDRYLAFFPPQSLAGMKVGFYEHSSVARDLLHELLGTLGAEVVPLGRTDDFVPIDTEAVAEEDVARAQRWASEYGFDAIVSTDGDADRPLVGDESGRWLRGDIAGILTAQHLGAQAVATTVSCNTALELCGAFAKVVRTRIGSPYVIEAIEILIGAGETRIVGFEPNGGFLVGSELEMDGRALAPLATRDAVLPILCLLSMAREKGCKLSGLASGLPARFTASDRLQDFPTETSRRLLENLAASKAAIDELLGGLGGKTARVDRTDGLRIFLDSDEIVHFRPSGNAPELRCYAEAASQQRAGELVREGLRRIEALADFVGRASARQS